MPLKIWDLTVEKLIDDFESFTAEMDTEIQRKLFKILAKLDTSGGKLTPQSLNKVYAEVQEIFATEFKGKDYKKQLQKIHDLVDVITDANVSIQKQLNNIDVTRKELTDINGLDLFKEKVINNLSTAGIEANVIIPMKQLINSAVNEGKGITSLITEFENMFQTGSTSQYTTIKGRSLLSYARQVANDTTNAVNGTIQTHLRDKYDLKGGRYIGNTIRDTRPFCKHMIEKESYPMPIARLRKVLKEYVGNKTKIQVGTLKSGKPKMVEKGAGMYPDTNAENFPAVVGGYNCRHRWFATRLENKK